MLMSDSAKSYQLAKIFSPPFSPLALSRVNTVRIVILFAIRLDKRLIIIIVYATL